MPGKGKFCDCIQRAHDLEQVLVSVELSNKDAMES